MGNKEETNNDKQCSSTEGMLELDNLALHHGANNTTPLADYLDDDDEDDDDDDSDSSSNDNDDDHPQHCTHFLGHTYNTHTDHHSMQTFQKSLYLLTYRNDLVVPLRPYSASNAQSLVGNMTHGGGLSGVTGEGGMKSDAGWGCMLRSAQMMMAQAVRRHYTLEEEEEEEEGGTMMARGVRRRRNKHGNLQGADGCSHRRMNSNNRNSNIEHRRQNWRQPEDPWEVERIAKWFADFPNHVDNDDDFDHEIVDNDENDKSDAETNTSKSSLLANEAKHANKNNRGDADDSYDDAECYGKGGLTNHWYSLHQMVAAGLGLGILPGEWYGPTTACHVLRELNEVHCERRERLAKALLKRKRSGRIYASEERGDDGCSNNLTCDMFRVHIATEGSIYLDAISKLMTQGGNSGSNDGSSSNDNDKNDAGKNNIDSSSGDPLSPPNDQIDDPLRPTTPQQQQQQTQNTLEPDIEQWDTSLLLLLPLRLGIQSISTSNYGSTMAKLLSFPQSVGMLGGTPRHALWFYGADAVEPHVKEEHSKDGGSDCPVVAGGWYGLDPHTVQSAPRGTRALLETKPSNTNRKNNSNGNNDATTTTNGTVTASATTNNNFQWQVQLTDTYLRSLHLSPTTSQHANHTKSILLSNLDPSCALGFYIRDSTDFVSFQRLIKSLKEEHCIPNKLPEVVTVLEQSPNYEVDGSMAMMRGLVGKGSGDDDDDGGVGGVVDDLDGFSIQSEEGNNDSVGHDDDDDDFVLI